MRHGNLSLAARELGMSQPAVSRHIRTLEGRLGQPLFGRNNNQIAPTAAARQLAKAIALGFGHVDQVWSQISAAPDPQDVTLACTFGFAEQWLMPRFSDLRRCVAPGRVRVMTTDQLGDIDLSRLDVAVVWDPEQMPERPSFPLFRSEVFPICSPDFLRSHPFVQSDIAALSADLFLHFDVGDSGFLTWADWFRAAGVAAPHVVAGAVFDAYPFMLQAVRRGEGLALGWRGLVDDALQSGEVIRLDPVVRDRDVSFYLQHRPLRTGPTASVGVASGDEVPGGKVAGDKASRDKTSGDTALAALLDWFRTATDQEGATAQDE